MRRECRPGHTHPKGLQLKGFRGSVRPLFIPLSPSFITLFHFFLVHIIALRSFRDSREFPLPLLIGGAAPTPSERPCPFQGGARAPRRTLRRDLLSLPDCPCAAPGAPRGRRVPISSRWPAQLCNCREHFWPDCRRHRHCAPSATPPSHS
jgi:hypothetical protein